MFVLLVPVRVLMYVLTIVPLANLSNSNTPMGPFHTTVLHSLSAALKEAMESGPMSRPCGVEVVMALFGVDVWGRRLGSIGGENG